LLLRPGRVCLSRGPKENGFRPAVDPLFRTAAHSYRGQVAGVILSGGLADGTSGLMRVKENRGIAIAQDPEEALFPNMPLSAMQNVEVDYIYRAREIAELLIELAHTPLPKGVRGMANAHEVKPDIAEIGTAALLTGEMKGPASGFVCPECGGALRELKDGKMIRYRCHSGHGLHVG